MNLSSALRVLAVCVPLVACGGGSDGGRDAGGGDDGGGRDGGALDATQGDETSIRDVSPWETCGPRQWLVRTSTGAEECVCLPPFYGLDCDQCSEGYEGEGCLTCSSGFLPTDRIGGGFDPDAEDPRAKSYAAVAWELRCERPATRTCAELDCGVNGTCDPGEGFAVCACSPGSTGPTCAECAPLYQAGPAGSCVLGASCRALVCGGLGACVVDAAGGFSCACDAPSTDLRCGTTDPLMLDAAGTPTPWHSLAPGEAVPITVPQDPAGGGSTAIVLSGPLTLERCVTCPRGASYLLTAMAIPPDDGVQFATVSVGFDPDPAMNPLLDIMIVPDKYVPITGPVHEELKPIYDNVLWFLKARGIRGAAIGISKGGTTIAANGFGFRDPGLDDDPWRHEGEGPALVQPTTPFRLASLTKPITAAAVRAALATEGINISSVSPGSRAADLIRSSTTIDLVNGPPEVPYSTAPSASDPGWSVLQVRHLINHEGGYLRDLAHNPTITIPNMSTSTLPSTQDPNGPGPQPDLQFGTGSFDVAFASQLFAISALNATGDPTVTFDKTLRFMKGVAFDYPPASPTANQDNYSNFGYELLGRVLEGASDRVFDPEEPTAPWGWGPYAELVQDFLCPLGITREEFFPGTGRPQFGEPAYRDLSGDAGVETLDAWDIDDPRRMRFVVSGGGHYEVCNLVDAADCDPSEDNGWTTAANTPSAYGGWATGHVGPAGGWVTNVGAYLKFARRFRTNVGTPGQGATGTGSPLAGVAAYIGNTMSSHNGALPGTWNWIWQLTGSNLSITMPTRTAAWSETLPAAAPKDNNGLVIINENLTAATNCSPPGDVAVVIFLNQRADYRAPIGTVSPGSNSTNGSVYGRVRDFVLSGVCQVDAWPLPQPGNVVAQPLICD